MAKNKAKGRKKSLLIVVAIILVVAIIVTGANVSAVNTLKEQGNSYKALELEDKLTPQKDENGNWYFTTDRDFKVMHLTDIHIGGGFMSKEEDEKALNAIAAMVTREKPDLVIASGDIAFPVPYTAGTFNNHSGAEAFGNLMESLGVYWDVTFGNHDAECYSYFDREAMAEFYEKEEFEHCLFQAGPADVDGFGNHTIEVKNSKGIITQAIILIDSQAYIKNNLIESIKGTYDNIHPNQVEWYESEILRMNGENEKIDKTSSPVKSLAFFHIPLVEFKDAWDELEANGFKNTDSVKFTGKVDFSTLNSEIEENSKKSKSYAKDKKGKIHYMGVYEYEGTYSKFATMGAKKYAYEDEKGLHLTISGVVKYDENGNEISAKELAEKGGFNAFRAGTVFAKAGGLEAVYNDEPSYGCVEVDGRSVQITKNVCLRPSTYTLGLAGEYNRLLEMIKIGIDNPNLL